MLQSFKSGGRVRACMGDFEVVCGAVCNGIDTSTLRPRIQRHAIASAAPVSTFDPTVTTE